MTKRVLAVSMVTALALLVVAVSYRSRPGKADPTEPVSTSVTPSVGSMLPISTIERATQIDTPEEPVDVEDDRGVISGLVTNVDGIGASQANISVITMPSYAGVVSRTLAASEGGEFKVSDLAFGRYEILARTENDVAFASVELTEYAPSAELTLVLVRGGSIQGVVVSAEGGIAGARVTGFIHDAHALSVTQQSLFSAETAIDGSFSIDSLPEHRWRFYVTADGFAPEITEPIAIGAANVRIELSPGAALCGVVVDDPTGSPLAGIVVVARRPNLEVLPESVITNNDGNFSISSLAPAKYELDILDDDRVLVTGPVAANAGGDDDNAAELRVTQSGVVMGRLIDRPTGAGIAGGRIRASTRRSQIPSRISETSDANGDFEISGLGAAIYTLQVLDIGGEPAVLNSRSEFNKRVSVHAIPGKRVEGIEIIVDRGLGVVGRVVYQDGRGVGGATVRAQDGRGWQGDAIADADGRFRLGGLHEPTDITIAAHSQSMENSNQGPFAVPIADSQELRIVLDLPRSGFIAGKVVDEHGQPVRARITGIQDGHSFPAMPAIERSGMDGRFLLANLTPGDWRLLGELDDMRPQVLATITIRAGQGIRDLRLVMTVGERLSISGRVTDSNGEPMRAGIALMGRIVGGGQEGTANSGAAETDHDGRYEIRNLSPGEYEVTCVAEGRERQELDAVAAGSSDVDFTFPAMFTLSGRVVDTQGHAITNYEIGQSRGAAPASRLPLTRVIHDDGFFSLDIEAGGVGLWVRAEAYQPEQFILGRIENDVSGLLFELRPLNARVNGVVTTPSGTPVSGAAIYLGRVGGSGQHATSDSDGSFVLDGVPEEALVVSAYEASNGYGTALADLSGGGEVEIEVVLTPPANLEGVVTDRGQPVPGCSVRLENEVRSTTAMPDSSGRFLIESFPSGPATLFVEIPSEDPDYVQHQPLPFNLAPGLHEFAEIDVGKSATPSEKSTALADMH